MSYPLFPALYQVNTRVLLTEISRDLGRPATLDDLRDELLDSWQVAGFDWIWLLSVWQTGTASQGISRTNPVWRQEFEQTLPDLTDDDIPGSGFAITAYDVHADLGGPAALARLRLRLQQRGLRLMLDFVPNHMGLGHPWVVSHPDRFIQGNVDDLAREPQNYVRVDDVPKPLILAHGRDPNFAGWSDTLQLNYAQPDTQLAMRQELLRIATQCDGVRCDMAMLVLPEVFERTWGEHSAPFWPATIAAVREQTPGFTLLAEAYWDLEWELQQQGFDFCYDKRLYDRLREQNANGIRQHLTADLAYQSKLTRFLENHDESRAAAVFSAPQHRAAALITYCSPGMRLFHYGQFEGRRVKISPHLNRGPSEKIDISLRSFYQQLLSLLRREQLRNGQWKLLDCQTAWPGNTTYQGFIAMLWTAPNKLPILVAVNESNQPGQCFVSLGPWIQNAEQWRFQDLMSGDCYDRTSTDLQERGLYLYIGPWQVHLFELIPLPATL